LHDPERRSLYDRGISNLDNLQARSISKEAEEKYVQGIAKSNKGDYRGAIKHFTEAVAHNRNYTAVYNSRGLAHYKLGDSAEAIDDFNQAIQINPNFAEAYYNRGLARFRLGYPQAAIEDYTQAINLKPDYGQAHYRRGLIHAELSDHQNAIADLQMAAKAFTAQSDLPSCQLAEAALQSLQVKYKSRQIMNGMRELANDIRSALSTFVVNPAGGMLPTYAKLTQARAVRLSMLMAITFNVCFTVGANLAWQKLYGNIVPIDKLVFTGAAVFLGFAASSFFMRSIWRGRGSFVGDLFVAGAALLPVGILVLLSGAIGFSNSAIALAVLTIFTTSYAILTTYSGCNQISNLSEEASTLSVPIMLSLTGFVFFACLAWMRPGGLRPDGWVMMLTNLVATN
jgi:Tfp pilus assembly protein PilF